MALPGCLPSHCLTSPCLLCRIQLYSNRLMLYKEVAVQLKPLVREKPKKSHAYQVEIGYSEQRQQQTSEDIHSKLGRMLSDSLTTLLENVIVWGGG